MRPNALNQGAHVPSPSYFHLQHHWCCHLQTPIPTKRSLPMLVTAILQLQKGIYGYYSQQRLLEFFPYVCLSYTEDVGSMSSTTAPLSPACPPTSTCAHPMCVRRRGGHPVHRPFPLYRKCSATNPIHDMRSMQFVAYVLATMKVQTLFELCLVYINSTRRVSSNGYKATPPVLSAKSTWQPFPPPSHTMHPLPPLQHLTLHTPTLLIMDLGLTLTLTLQLFHPFYMIPPLPQLQHLTPYTPPPSLLPIMALGHTQILTPALSYYMKKTHHKPLLHTPPLGHTVTPSPS
mmetsp:Transcript_38635/g.62567  ORF Transcript_38635/g.62567 Transcript_38635/m.62567 type:complete len:289 (-) Transcript_38635:901-1767(-)